MSITRKLSHFEKIKARHPELDFSVSDYQGSLKPLTFKCSIHGIVTQGVESLLPNGCKHCTSGRRKVTIGDFVERATAVHGTRYDYTRSNIQSMLDLIDIDCSIHGPFRQAANDHLKGRGCKQCGSDYSGKTCHRHMSLDAFNEIIERRIKDADDCIEFNGFQKQARFSCPTHGEYLQWPSNFLHSSQCRLCQEDANKASTMENFSSRCALVHEGKYEYKSFDGIDALCEIVCPQHGLFLLRAADHLYSEAGCPDCASTRFRKQNEWLDVMNVKNREVDLVIDGRLVRCDGFDPLTSTIYKFWEDFWHGNPNVFCHSDINTVTKSSFADLYASTLEKRDFIIKNGFELIDIWEHDWNKINEKNRRGKIRP